MTQAFHARSLVTGLLLGAGLSVGVIFAARSFHSPIQQPSWHFAVSGNPEKVWHFVEQQKAKRPNLALRRFTADRRQGKALFDLAPVTSNVGAELILLQGDALALHLSNGFTNGRGDPLGNPAPKAA